MGFNSGFKGLNIHQPHSQRYTFALFKQYP